MNQFSNEKHFQKQIPEWLPFSQLKHPGGGGAGGALRYNYDFSPHFPTVPVLMPEDILKRMEEKYFMRILK